MFRQEKVEAGVPVDDEGDVKHECYDSEKVGVVGATLGAPKEHQHSVDAEQPIETNYDLSWPQVRDEVEKIERDERENIENKLEGLDIVEGQLLQVCHWDTILQMTYMR